MKVCNIYRYIRYNKVSNKKNNKALGGEKMKVKEYRVQKGFKQVDIANILGIKQNTYSDKERGKTKFTIDEIKLIKELLNVTYDELLS